MAGLDLDDFTLENMHHCFRDISSLPNVHKLTVTNATPGETTSIIEKFSQLCPNITNLFLYHICASSLEVVQTIWTRFKGLKSLKIELTVTDNNNNPFDLDSAFSGYSLESIERIKSKLERGISMEEARRGEQQNPSILDLKGNFILFYYSNNEHGITFFI